MANIFSSMMNNVGDWFAAKVAGYLNDPMTQRSKILGSYYSGDHVPQLKRTVGKQDDNIIQNYVGLAVDRSVSRLLQGGVKFVLPENSTDQQEWLDKVWDLNKKEIRLYQQGLYGAVHGTCYFKICPDEIVDPFTNYLYPRLVDISQEIIRVRTEPDDANEVVLYQIRYQVGNTIHCEITHRSDVQYTFDKTSGEAVVTPAQAVNISEVEEAQQQLLTWVVDEWEQSATYGNQLTLTSSVEWQYDFPPIIHWKNLPSLNLVYGDSEVDDTLNIQDKSNFVVSNTSKIIKNHAHPNVVGTGFSVDQMDSKENAVGTFTAIQNPDADIKVLEMQSDLSSSRNFANDLRQSIFDIAREVDISTIKDKLGALTNFGLKVLYTDAINKNDTKRQLYGDALKELNRRLLVIHGWQGEDSDPGTIQWGDAMPVNVLEDMQADQMALDMGIVDKETVARRYEVRYGVDWETIQQRLQDQQQNANQNSSNIGALLLRNFNQGNGAPNNAPMNNQNQAMNQQQMQTNMQNVMNNANSASNR